MIDSASEELWKSAGFIVLLFVHRNPSILDLSLLFLSRLCLQFPPLGNGRHTDIDFEAAGNSKMICPELHILLQMEI
jgi:hypothetical protein